MVQKQLIPQLRLALEEQTNKPVAKRSVWRALFLAGLCCVLACAVAMAAAWRAVLACTGGTASRMLSYVAGFGSAAVCVWPEVALCGTCAC